MAKLTDEILIGQLMYEYGLSREEVINGYGFFENEFGAVEVCRIDDLYWCDEFDYGIETDEDAGIQAEKDGVKFINNIEGVDKHRYIDTPRNRYVLYREGLCKSEPDKPEHKINADAIRNVITFLVENEQYGDDWSEEIEELNKVLNIALGQ
jgi:hypothetical protein